MLLKNFVQAIFLLSVCINFFPLNAGKKNKSFAQYWVSGEQIKVFLNSNPNIAGLLQESDKSGAIDQQVLQQEIKNCFYTQIRNFSFGQNSTFKDVLDHCFEDSAKPLDVAKKTVGKNIADFNQKILKQDQQTDLWRFPKTWPRCKKSSDVGAEFINLLSEAIGKSLNYVRFGCDNQIFGFAVIALRAGNDKSAFYFHFFMPASSDQVIDGNQKNTNPQVVCLNTFCLQHGDLLHDVAAAAGEKLKLLIYGSVAGMITYVGLQAYENLM